MKKLSWRSPWRAAGVLAASGSALLAVPLARRWRPGGLRVSSSWRSAWRAAGALPASALVGVRRTEPSASLLLPPPPRLRAQHMERLPPPAHALEPHGSEVAPLAAAEHRPVVAGVEGELL